MKDCRLFLLMWLLAGAQAAELVDPTRPPGPLPAAASAAASAVPLLQGLRVGSRPSAVIEGRLLRPGQRWRDHTLLRVEIDAVVLRDGQGRTQRLLLLPEPAASRPRPEVRP